MKVKVIECFVDKYTNETYEAGDILSIKKVRFDEIQSVGNFVELLEDEPEKPEKPKGKSKAGKQEQVEEAPIVEDEQEQVEERG